MPRIGGYQKLTLLDYPGKLAAIVFMGGCNFRCPFCHNSELFTPSESYEPDEVLKMLKKRASLIEGVVITGGEPTLQPDLEDFIRAIRDMGLMIKLDTNGYRPDVLQHLCSSGLIDYVAMDIKSSPEHYAEVAGLPGLDIDLIKESVSFLIKEPVPYEFRTTVVPELHEEADFESISRWIGGASAYYLQGYKDSEMVLDRIYSQPSRELMEHIRDIVLPLVPNTQIRGYDT